MLNPEIAKLLDNNDSIYSIVIAVAKRSRDLAERAEYSHVELKDKPVNIAIEEICDNKIRLKK